MTPTGHAGPVDTDRMDQRLNQLVQEEAMVALWNSNARQPVGLQFEVMDMIYGLPPKDWLDLDTDANG